MDPDGRWQALQLHLRSARAAREAGDVTLALQEVDAALSIDPDYLAARVLRESLAQATPPHSEPQPPDSPTANPLSLEERARRRRMEQRIGAARTAMLLGRLDEARAALDELEELEPALPVIPEIAAELHAARARVKRKRSMLPVAVAAGVAGVIAGTLAGRATQGHRQPARPDFMSVAPLTGNAIPTFSVSPPVSAPTLSAELFEPAATAPAVRVAIAPARADPFPAPPAAAPTLRARIGTPAPAAERRVSAAAVAERASPAPPAERPPPAAERPTATPVPVERVPEAPPTVSPRVDRPSEARPAIAVDDPALIRDTLQRYRRAYNALDARLAHAVYPGVDQAALTHAFEGLRSQSLEFEACSVDALAESARAVCRGSARFVPKIGSREPRAEPRVWTFRLRKNEGDWRIESAWTDR